MVEIMKKILLAYSLTIIIALIIQTMAMIKMQKQIIELQGHAVKQVELMTKVMQKVHEGWVIRK